MSDGIAAATVVVLVAAVLGLWVVGERRKVKQRPGRDGLHVGGLRGLLSLKALHVHFYGRWPSQYVRLVTRLLPWACAGVKRRWSDGHHGKILTHDHAEAIIGLGHDVEVRDLEQVIPYPIARDLVLEGPPDVAVYECACRSIRDNPCQPAQVCMVVGQPFVDFILEHQPETSRRLSQSEALELLREEHERGHMHSAWFWDAMLDRFYSICNCCKCCCAGIEAMTRHQAPTLASSGYVARVDHDLCNACGKCASACPFDALVLNETACALDWKKCMGCGVCVSQCRDSALTLARDEKKGVPLDVRLLDGC